MKPCVELVSASRRKGGRPLSFDRDAALEQAMLLFWRHGYETTSISDLTAAMGITAPSLYTAFGDKRRLFLEAAKRYANPEASAVAISNAPTAYDAARVLLDEAVAMFTGEGTPPGCLLASATASGSAASADVQTTIAKYRAEIRDHLQCRIQQDVRIGLLPDGTDAAALAGLVVAVVQGLSVLARDGASRAFLSSVAEVGLRGWPDGPVSTV